MLIQNIKLGQFINNTQKLETPMRSYCLIKLKLLKAFFFFAE